MTQLTIPPTDDRQIKASPRSPLAALADDELREMARESVVNRLYRKIPFSLACELHERLIVGDMSAETKQLIREALIHAKSERPVN